MAKLDIDKLLEKVPYDKLYPIPAWQRFSAIGGVAVILLGLFYFLVIKSQDQKIDALNQDLTKIKKDVEDNKAHTKRLKELQQKISGLENSLQEAKKQLPTEKEIPSLLEQISNTGNRFGLEFVTFKPGAEITRDFYSEVPVSLDIVGNFHNILQFYDEIANLPRIVTISDIKMNSMSAGKTSSGNSSDLQVSCLATTYRFIEGSENPGNKGAADAAKK